MPPKAGLTVRAYSENEIHGRAVGMLSEPYA